MEVVGWRLHGVRVPSFTNDRRGAGRGPVALFEDGELMDDVEASEHGESTRSMRAESLPWGFD